jgi:hypothetical protein
MVFPGLAADVPAGHGVHVEDPVSLAYVPGSHDVHVAPVYPESCWYWPDGQEAHRHPYILCGKRQIQINKFNFDGLKSPGMVQTGPKDIHHSNHQ